MNTKTKVYSLRSRTVLSRNKIFSKDLGELLINKSYHKTRESLFSSPSFKIVNSWFLLPLILSNVGLALENISKYGILINPFLWLKIYFGKLTELPSVLILSGLNIFSLSSLGLEILLFKGILSVSVHLTLVILFLTIEILVPLFVLNFFDSFVIGFTIVVSYITVFLKLISYHMINYGCRQNVYSKTAHSSKTDQEKERAIGIEDKNVTEYPDNLNVRDIYYFLFAPTLCYELNFPLLPHIRKTFLFKRVVEMAFLLPLMLSIIQQSIVPVVLHYQDFFQDQDYIKISEIFLKLAIAVYASWLLGFYIIFHSWLNILGEISRFGDRLFYKDWWNTDSLADWWRKWNIPVHKWCFYHIYTPLLQSGFTKFQAVCIVTFVSAIFHEYMLSLPLKIFKILIFANLFFGQMSYFILTIDQPLKYGNMILCWFILFLQPLLLLNYYYESYVKHSARL